MNHFAAVKSPLPVAAAGDAKSPLFCPKPRRPVAPLRCHQSGGGLTDAGAGMDLLDLLLSKVGSFCLRIFLTFRSARSPHISSSRGWVLTVPVLLLAGRGERPLGAAAVLRVAAAASVEPGGPRQPVRHGLPARARAGGSAGLPHAAPVGGAIHVAARRRRVRSRPVRLPAAGGPCRGF
jgi:hypothetical protein